MKTALITGISGFVGPYIADALLAAGWRVRGLIRRSALCFLPPRLVPLAAAGDFSVEEGDLTDLTSLLNALDRSRPDVIFHLAAQSYVPRSFSNPLETIRVNTTGTANLLEAVRIKNLPSTIVFAGSSEEYGLQFSSESQYLAAVHRFGNIYPRPDRIPELPISESNPLRPMSPYAASKVQADYLMQNYHYSFGLRTIVSRAFNHEGAGRGHEFVTSSLVRQCVCFALGESDSILVGNVNAFRDWSHVLDVVRGYLLLAESGAPGEVYVQGSMRTHSVLSYLLFALDELGYRVQHVETLDHSKCIEQPLDTASGSLFGVTWSRPRLDDLLLREEFAYDLNDRGLRISTSRGEIQVHFDAARFRPAEVPILLSDTRKIQQLGFSVTRSLRDIIRDQANFYFNAANRPEFILPRVATVGA